MTSTNESKIHALRQSIQQFLDISPRTENVAYSLEDSSEFDGYRRELICYEGTEQDEIRAWRFVPAVKTRAAVLVNHQHNGERHFGKSEVAGLCGDPYQSFGPALAERGILVLAPDSVCFEDRRHNATGIDEDAGDFLQHYNEMAYRLLRGTTLMKKVIEDSSIAISVLLSELAGQQPVGILGHSYGGNTALFHGALDERIDFIGSSGALCSFANKIQFGTGIEKAEIIPGFLKSFEMVDLMRCLSPRPTLILSATDDKYSLDADEICHQVEEFFQHRGELHLTHLRFAGGHELDEERFDAIVAWCCARGVPSSTGNA